MKYFVSYAKADDSDFAYHIKVSLEKKGKNFVFVDSRSIAMGEEWDQRIKNSISEFDALCDHNPLALERPEVEKEILEAENQSKKIIPCIISGMFYQELKWNLNKKQGIQFEDKFDLVKKILSFEQKIPVMVRRRHFKIL